MLNWDESTIVDGVIWIVSGELQVPAEFFSFRKDQKKNVSLILVHVKDERNVFSGSTRRLWYDDRSLCISERNFKIDNTTWH